MDIQPNKDNDKKILDIIKKPKDNKEITESIETEEIEYFTE